MITPTPFLNEQICNVGNYIVYFDMVTLEVTWISHVSMNTFDPSAPIRYGVHGCGKKLIVADGILICEKCKEVITFDSST